MKEDDARSVSTRDRVKGVPLTELEKVMLIIEN